MSQMMAPNIIYWILWMMPVNIISLVLSVKLTSYLSQIFQPNSPSKNGLPAMTLQKKPSRLWLTHIVSIISKHMICTAGSYFPVNIERFSQEHWLKFISPYPTGPFGEGGTLANARQMSFWRISTPSVFSSLPRLKALSLRERENSTTWIQ